MFTNYTVHETLRTPNGTILDDPKSELNPSQIDSTLATVSRCVAEIAQTGFTDEEYVKGECSGTLIQPEIYACLNIKVAPDWTMSCAGTDQVFPCNVGNARCEQKGLTPTAECPCRCRAQIQPNSTIIVTPNLKLLPAYFTTLMTGCLSPWVGRLAKCASPDNVAAVP